MEATKGEIPRKTQLQASPIRLCAFPAVAPVFFLAVCYGQYQPKVAEATKVAEASSDSSFPAIRNAERVDHVARICSGNADWISMRNVGNWQESFRAT